MPLGLNDVQKNQLVAFLLGLTDDRVKFEKAPFDHPQLLIPTGHPTLTSDPSNPGQAPDSLVPIDAVGRDGSATAIRSFTAAVGASAGDQ